MVCKADSPTLCEQHLFSQHLQKFGGSISNVVELGVKVFKTNKL